MESVDPGAVSASRVARAPAVGKVFLGENCRFDAPSEQPTSVTGLLLALGADIVTAAIGRGVGLAVQAVAAKGEPDQQTVEAAGNGSLHIVTDDDPPGVQLGTGCVTFVYGYVGEGGGFAGSAFEEDFLRQQLAEMGFRRPPLIAAEFRIEPSDDRSAFAPEISFLSYDAPLIGAAGKARDLTFSLTFDSFAGDRGNTTFANFIINFDDFTAPVTLKGNDLVGQTAAFQPIPAPVDMSRVGKTTPIRVSVTATETRDGSEFTKQVAELLGEQQGAITETGQKALVTIIERARK